MGLRRAVSVREFIVPESVTRPELRDYLAEHPAFFESVLAESEGKAAG